MIWPFSEIKNLREALASANKTTAQAVKNTAAMQEVVSDCDSMLTERAKLIEKLANELEIERMRLVACGVAAQCNTRESAAQQRVSKDSPYFCASVADVHNAVDREMSQRELAVLMRTERDAVRTLLEEANDRAFRASEAHVVTMGNFNMALDIIGQVVKTKLQGDMRDNAQEAEKFYNQHRGTKTCVMCGSEMIPMHSEDKKLCSNGACGHEVEWKLEDGQQYQYKRNVEPFVEDRSNVREELEPPRATLERL